MRALAVLSGLLLLRLAAFQVPQTQAQSRPVFRGGTHFVRVDAYPTDQRGAIVEGLTAADFEILEDGKPQTVDSLDFIRFDAFTPETERRNPSSQREGFELAADPRYRVFVIFVDMGFSSGTGVFVPVNDLGRIQQPLVNFIDRVIGVHDLFGLLSSRNTVKDLVLGQKTTATAEQIRDLWRASHVDFEPAERFAEPGCLTCRAGRPGARDCNVLMRALVARYHADQTYTELRELIALLGSIREERKNIVFVSNTLGQWRDDPELYDRLHAEPPKLGINNGRIDRGDPRTTPVTDDFCTDAVNRLPLMDFEKRYQQVLTEAREANVAFYAIPPSGLQAPSTETERRVLEAANDGLIELARETGGLAVVDSNDLNAGMRRIAEDQSAYYVLGYYTTNTKFDGRVRKIAVRLKGQAIRARREYRAPTQAEIAALANRPPPAAVDAGPPVLIGSPVAYHVALRQPPQKVTRLEFARTDRLRVEFPILSALDRREARVLDSSGKPLPIDVPLSENDAAKTVVVELSLAPFTRGVYAIELTAGAGGKTEQRRLTFTIR